MYGMQPIFTGIQQQLLRVIFDRGAENASQALSKWLDQEVHLAISEVESTELENAAELLGPADTLVTACTMELTGWLTGWILVVFDDRSGLALVDLLLRLPIGTTTTWSELEESAVKETTNIVGCAYVNALAAHLPSPSRDESVHPSGTHTNAAEIVPSPPTFFHEFAGSLLQFALVEQALELDEVLMIRSEFTTGGQALNLNWTLLFVPTREALSVLSASLAQLWPQ
jgi:chemotaxis protein CheC